MKKEPVTRSSNQKVDEEEAVTRSTQQKQTRSNFSSAGAINSNTVATRTVHRTVPGNSAHNIAQKPSTKRPCRQSEDPHVGPTW